MYIRIARSDELLTVSRITRTTISEVYPKYYPAGAVAFFLRHHSDKRIAADIAAGNVYLLEDETGIPVGTVTVSGNEICRLFVLPAHQKKGFGRMLIDYAEQLISEKYDCIVLDASLPAKAIYLKRGYISTEYHCIAAENGDMLCYDVMIKRLP